MQLCENRQLAASGLFSARYSAFSLADFDIVVQGGSELVDKIGEKTDKGLRAALPFIFDAVALAAGITGLPGTVRNIVGGLKKFFREPVIAFLTKLGQKLLDYIKKLLGFDLGNSASQPISRVVSTETKSKDEPKYSAWLEATSGGDVQVKGADRQKGLRHFGVGANAKRGSVAPGNGRETGTGWKTAGNGGQGISQEEEARQAGQRTAGTDEGGRQNQ